VDDFVEDALIFHISSMVIAQLHMPRPKPSTSLCKGKQAIRLAHLDLQVYTFDFNEHVLKLPYGNTGVSQNQEKSQNVSNIIKVYLAVGNYVFMQNLIAKILIHMHQLHTTVQEDSSTFSLLK
jgi:hypothetical protein